MLMKRLLLCLSLLTIAPLACFLGDYLRGAGVLPEGYGFLASAVAMFVLPWLIACLCSILIKAKAPIRVLFFIVALVAQGVLLFTAVPPGATCEMMGIAHRFRGEFSPDKLRGCADNLRQKFRDGTLSVRPCGKDEYFLVGPSAVVVSDSELPSSLRGRFKRVFIQKPQGAGEEQVVFALGAGTGVICNGRKDDRGFFVCSMADGVEAYRYQRG